MNRLSISLLVAAAISISAAQRTPTIDSQYRDIAGRLVGAALVDQGGWEKLSYLTTRIGNRLSGSASLERAVQWTFDRMKAEGLDNPRLQPVKVVHWVRGRESLRIVAPVERPIAMLGLGGSVATGPEGVTAPVVPVTSFDELEALGEAAIKGKIVLYAVEWRGYGETNTYRTSGPSRAARLGAVASLVRSMTGTSLYTPHTGNQTYAAGVRQIPAAAITVEDAAWIRRTVEAGQEVRVHLQMEAQTLPETNSNNVIAEIVGWERPDEVVVVGGHIDSWDVGQGAHDDGGGVVAAWQAVTLIKQLGLKPRRTIRVVAWTNEENGTGGAQAYLASLGNDVSKHVAAIEMDDGAERPLGYRFEMNAATPNSPQFNTARAKLLEISRFLEDIGANTIVPGSGGADVTPLMRQGVPVLGVLTTMEHYFDWHHTNADTLDKVDLQDFRKNIASLAVMAYVLADMPGYLK